MPIYNHYQLDPITMFSDVRFFRSFWMIGLFTLLGLGWANAQTLSITKSASVTSVNAGTTFRYTLQYRCVSITNNCQNVVVTDVLPPQLASGASDVAVYGSQHTTSVSYDAGTRTAQWVMQNPLGAGSTGDLYLDVKFPAGTTPNGTVALNTARITASNAATVTSNQVSVTALATPSIVIDKYLIAGGGAGYETVYGIAVANNGTINLSNVALTDNLPPGSVFVAATSGGTSGGSTVSWPGFTLDVGQTRYFNVVIQMPSGSFSVGQNVTNTATAVGTPIGGGSVSATDSETFALVAPSCETGFSIWSNKRRLSTGDDTATSSTPYAPTLFINVANTGKKPISDGFSMVLDVPPQVNVTSIVANITPETFPSGTYTSYPGSLNVMYKTNLNSTYQHIAGSPFSAFNYYEVTVASLGLAPNEYITAIRYGSNGPLPVGYDARSGLAYRYELLSTDRTGAAVLTGSNVTFSYSGNYGCEGSAGGPGGPGGGPSGGTPVTGTDVVPVVDPTIYLGLYKGVSPGSGIPGAELTYSLAADAEEENTTHTITNPVWADLLPIEVEYVAGSASPAPDQVIYNYQGTGRTYLRWTITGTFNWIWASGTLVTYRAKIRPGVMPGTFENTWSIINPNYPIEPAYGSTKMPDMDDLDGDGDTAEILVKSPPAVVTVSELAALESFKWVRGELDAGESRYPESGKTTPGGKADYRLIVRNLGNVPMKDIVLIDILPFIGDTGVIDPQARLTQWRPNLISAVSGPPTATVYYSTANNPCRSEVLTPDPVGCQAPNWTSSVPSDLISVQSLKFNFGSLVLAPGDSLQLAWQMRAPVGAPTNGEIAWNSFGYATSRADNSVALLPTEPIKVGIEIQPSPKASLGNYVWLDDNRNGIQDEPAANGLNGVAVELWSPGPDMAMGGGDDVKLGTTATGLDFSGNPGYYLFPNLDAGKYYVKFFAPSGYSITPKDNSATTDLLDNDADPITGKTDVTDLSVGENDLSWDAGIAVGLPCSLNPPTVLATCQDSGTPSDPSDDVFTFTVQATGTNTGSNFSVTKTLPAPSAVIFASVNYGATSPASASFPIAGGNLTLALTDNSTPSCTLPNVTVTPPATCSNLPPPADLELIKTSDKTVVRPGELIEYTLTVTNRGPGSAPAVKVRDVIPYGLTFIGAIPSTGTYNSSTGVWDVGNLANAGIATLKISVRVN